MIPSAMAPDTQSMPVYQRGVVIDSQPFDQNAAVDISISKGSGD